MWSSFQTEKQAQYFTLLSFFFLLEIMVWCITDILSHSNTLYLRSGKVQSLLRKAGTTGRPQARLAGSQRLDPKDPSACVLTWHGFSITAPVKPVLSSTVSFVTIWNGRFFRVFATELWNSVCKLESLSCIGVKGSLPHSMSLNCPGSASWITHHAGSLEKCLPSWCSLRPFPEQDRTACLFNLLSHHISDSVLDMMSIQDKAV